VPIISIPSLKCLRCGYVWRPRQPEVRLCPRCKSVRWDTPKVRRPPRGGGTGVEELLGPHRREILRLARKYHARRLRVFGSVARHAATPRSDVDLLLDRAPGWKALDRVQLREALERLLGRRVEITTEQGLHEMVRAQVLSEAIPV
jgi:uncharacterized protein